MESSSKYNMMYFNIRDLENKLGMSNLATGLWKVTSGKLESQLRDCIPNSTGMELSFYKEKSQDKDSNNSSLFRGVFAVAAEDKVTPMNMKILLTEYIKSNPNLDRTIPASAYNADKISESRNQNPINNNMSDIGPSNNINTTDKSISSPAYEVNMQSDNIPENNIDLNAEAELLDESSRLFGVIDDINHIQYLKKIEGIDIIENVGDFRKIYFSIPSYRLDEALAHSVTMLYQIKCKRALLDYIV